ncbi:LysR substrate-binding domain-containing protein [Tateyamaria sp.]|uniref:LysR substrate-binding domain-containing protein n=1 Tax=Tateyamaria sp. TaxID=1929288 RepID=UPI00328CA046
MDRLKALSFERPFDPTENERAFTIAANDMQRELVFPRLIRDLSRQGIDATFEFIPSGHPTPALLRNGRCDLALTPFPPDASDILQKQIFEGRMMCFFDGSIRRAPATLEQYIRSDHVSVKFPDGGTSRRALKGVDTFTIPKARVSVPNFGAIPAFVKGSAMVATEMDLMKISCLKDLDIAPLPFASKPVSVFMSWHIRDSNEAAHIWLRETVEQIANDVGAEFSTC